MSIEPPSAVFPQACKLYVDPGVIVTVGLTKMEVMAELLTPNGVVPLTAPKTAVTVTC